MLLVTRNSYFKSQHTIKGVRGTKVKVIFQGLHMTCVIYMLVYNFFLKFWLFSLTLYVRYKYVLIEFLKYDI
jgi:hypothetical protein